MADCSKTRLLASERAQNSLGHLVEFDLPLKGSKLHLEQLRNGSYEENPCPVKIALGYARRLDTSDQDMPLVERFASQATY